jgi:hypothetical protein
LGRDARIQTHAANVNLRNIESTDDIKAVLQVTADNFTGRIDDARRGTIRDEQLRQLASESGVSVNDLLSRRSGDAFNAEQILSARLIMGRSADNLLSAAKKAADSGLEEDLINYRNALNLHVAIQEQVSGLAAEAGRALSQFRIAAGTDIDEFLRQAGGRNNLREGATLLAQLDDIGQITRAARQLNQPTITDKFLEVWINGLLSGPQTHAVNALSNTFTSLWTIPEHFLAAGIGAIKRTPNRETFTEAFSRVYGWAQGARDGFSLARKAFLTEEPSDVFSKLEARRPQAISGRTGQFVRLPGRALIASDEFFKSIGYRMELNAAATRSALEAGLNPRTREFAQHVQNIIDNPPDNIHLQSVENARYLTFTKKLEGVSRHITEAQTELPLLRLIMPFVRTPTNIVRFAGERTPLGFAMREFRNARGPARDRQLAKITLGSMAGAAIASYAAEGKITGSGPSDPAARQALRDTGWQPYSFVIDTPEGTRYLSFQRVEPLGILFGLAADFSDIAGELEEGERDEIASRITGAIAQNLTDKTFFKGLSDVIEAFNDPDRFMDVYIQNFGGTLIPTAAAQIARTTDPTLRDTQSVMDRIKSRIPGFSDDLPARRNLWGEPITLGGGLGPDLISPIYSSFGTNDPVSNELVRLELFPPMPQRRIDGAEIPSKLYWAYVENAGKPAHRQLEELITSPEWKQLDQFPETQRSIIRDIVQENRDVARAVLRLNMGKVLSGQERAMLEQFGIDVNSIEQRAAEGVR